jgi:hypothetical protein
VFFFGGGAILCSSQSGDDLLEDLDKFGYKLNRKIIFLKMLSIIFCYLLEPCIEIWQIFLNCGWIMAIEYLEKHLILAPFFFYKYSLLAIYSQFLTFCCWQETRDYPIGVGFGHQNLAQFDPILWVTSAKKFFFSRKTLKFALCFVLVILICDNFILIFSVGRVSIKVCTRVWHVTQIQICARY